MLRSQKVLHTKKHGNKTKHVANAVAGKTLIRALILSRLDYCNSLFANSSQSTLHRLQRARRRC